MSDVASDRDNAIELRGVGKLFGSAVALQPLDLDVRDGEFFCLLGPSGCGKTTTLNLVGGFMAPSSGTISIRGTDVTRLPPHKRPVNTIFQSYALFPHMNVVQNVQFGLRMSKVSRAEREALRRTRLLPWSDSQSGPTSRSPRSPAGRRSGSPLPACW